MRTSSVTPAATYLPVAIALTLTAWPARAQVCPRYEVQKITASDASKGDHLGKQVSMDGDWFVVGAAPDDDACPSDPDCNSGAAYIFRRDPSATPPGAKHDVWVEDAKLTASDSEADDLFGSSVSIDGRYILVGAWDYWNSGPGKAYVFWRNDNDTPTDPRDDFWVEQSKLTASDGAVGDRFGVTVSISGDWAAVGAPYDDDVCPGDPNCDSGSVYVYRRDDNDTVWDASDDFWVEAVKLTASDAAAGDEFGEVSIRGTTVVVGSPFDDELCPTDPECNSGSAYVFYRDDNGTPGDLADDTWVEQDKWIASDPVTYDLFGKSVSISPGGGRVLIAARHGTDYGSGKTYIFRREDAGTPSDPSDDS